MKVVNHNTHTECIRLDVPWTIFGVFLQESENAKRISCFFLSVIFKTEFNRFNLFCFFEEKEKDREKLKQNKADN